MALFRAHHIRKWRRDVKKTDPLYVATSERKEKFPNKSPNTLLDFGCSILLINPMPWGYGTTFLQLGRIQTSE